MLQTNPEIDYVVEEATKIAKSYQHEYVTVEHVMLAIVRYDPLKRKNSFPGGRIPYLEEEFLP